MDTQEKLITLEPFARAFAQASLDLGYGFTGLRFGNAVVVFIRDETPGSDKMRAVIGEIQALTSVERVGEM